MTKTMCDAIILVDKPTGFSSNQVLQKVKRMVGAKKAGHTGSLDPLATGMLPICVGRATKVCEYLLARDKAYVARFKLGETTTTGDSEGDCLTTVSVPNFSRTRLQEALLPFRGERMQVPPMYSALKHHGEPLYKLARRGQEVDRRARPVTIYQLEIMAVDLPFIDIKVICSKGTYIRRLVEEIGEDLNVGAHLTALHRCYCAGFKDQPMYSLEALQSLVDAGDDRYYLSIDAAFQDVSSYTLNTDQWQTIQYGQPIFFDALKDGRYRFIYQDKLVGFFDIQAEKIKRRKVLADC